MSARWVASGSAISSATARQLVGTTSKPTPGQRRTPACLGLGNAGVQSLEHRDLAGNIASLHSEGLEHRIHGIGVEPRLELGE